MPAITFERFDGGLDVRQLASSADANRLRTLKNAYVTTGRTIRKRPGLRKVADLPTGCKGLFSGLDALWTFSGRTVDYVENVSNAVLSVDADITDVLHVEVFNGYLYLCAKHRNGMTQHYYLDGSPGGAAIVDEHCPHSAGFIKKAGKIFAIQDDVVRFSATGNARDWTTEKNAGFLPVALQQSVNNKPVALGEYNENLVVFFEDSAQIWAVDPDPLLHRLVTTVPIGTRYSHSHANMASDIFFLAPSGFRSVAVQAFSSNMMDNDIGSPIDALVQADMRRDITPKMVYWRGVGQLMCFMGDYAYVYSYSRASKISAWSMWHFPFPIDAAAEHETRLYLRSGNVLYVLDETAYSDDGAPIEVVTELPYLDMKRPGTLKQFTGVDVAAAGGLNLRFKFDPANPQRATPALRLSGDTRPLPRIPVEVMATNLAIEVSNVSDGLFELAAITVYYENLSGFAT